MAESNGARKPHKKRTAESVAHRRIANDLREQIRAGRWGVGAMLPSRRDLALEYRVSSVTIGRAVMPLIAEGTLHADDRRGTFVARRPGDLVAIPHPPAGETSAPAAASPATGLIGIVAAIYPGSDYWDATVVNALEGALSESGHVTTVYNRVIPGETSLRTLPEAIGALLDQGVAGLVILAMDIDRVGVEETLAVIDMRNVPAVCVTAGELHLPVPHIFYDQKIGGYQAARHLLDKGHRHITVIAPTVSAWSEERIAGIRQAMARAGLPDAALEILAGDRRRWQYSEHGADLAAATIRAALESGWIPSGGIIGITDWTTQGFLDAIAGTGRTAGKDFALVSFDDTPFARTYGLTSMRPPFDAMGHEAARLLLAEMRGSAMSHQIRLRAHLIPRASTYATDIG